MCVHGLFGSVRAIELCSDTRMHYSLLLCLVGWLVVEDKFPGVQHGK